MSRDRRSRQADVGVVITTHNALPWIEQCLASVEGVDTVVVDNDSSDDTVAFVRERFPAVTVIEQANRGLAAGWARGLEELPDRRWALILNADAWLVGDALERMVALGDASPEVAVVAPKLLNLDGSLQRSVRGFPTRWRLATEYYYLRKLGPHTELLNGFYGGGFDHASEREVECVMGACMLVRRAAIDEVGTPDAELLPLQRRGGLAVPLRRRRAGRHVFTPDAQCMHVGGASHGGRLYRDNLRGHMRFFLKHHGLAQAESVRSLLRTATVLRGRIVRGEKGAMYRDAARWLGTGDVRSLIER